MSFTIERGAPVWGAVPRSAAVKARNQLVAHHLSERTAILLDMDFTPHNTNPQACWHCTHFLALIYQDTAAKCGLPPGIRAMPQHGCAFWEREVGADDEAGPPVTTDEPRRLVATDRPVEVAWAP